MVSSVHPFPTGHPAISVSPAAVLTTLMVSSVAVVMSMSGNPSLSYAYSANTFVFHSASVARYRSYGLENGNRSTLERSWVLPNLIRATLPLLPFAAVAQRNTGEFTSLVSAVSDVHPLSPMKKSKLSLQIINAVKCGVLKVTYDISHEDSMMACVRSDQLLLSEEEYIFTFSPDWCHGTGTVISTNVGF